MLDHFGTNPTLMADKNTNCCSERHLDHNHDYKERQQHLKLVDPAQVEDGDDLHDVGGIERSESHVEPLFATMHRLSGIKISRWIKINGSR